MTPQPTVYFLIGSQGSGKSTWAAAQAASLGAVVLASDEIRNQLEAQGVDARHQNDRVFGLLESRLDALLTERHHVLVDATHARRAWREKELAIARARGAKTIAIWFACPLAVCLARNAQKPGTTRWGERVVSPSFLRRVHAGLEPPTPEEFDEIRMIGTLSGRPRLTAR